MQTAIVMTLRNVIFAAFHCLVFFKVDPVMIFRVSTRPSSLTEVKLKRTRLFLNVQTFLQDHRYPGRDSGLHELTGPFYSLGGYVR